MSIWTSLEPASVTVDAGSRQTVLLRLRNTGDVVDEYRFTAVGPVAQWTTIEPPVLRLYPGTAGEARLTFTPPRRPDATAGPNPYAVEVVPVEHPQATTVVEGNLTVTPFTEVRAELVPPTVKGRLRGRSALAVDNFGNCRLTVSVTGSDNSNHSGTTSTPPTCRSSRAGPPSSRPPCARTASRGSDRRRPTPSSSRYATPAANRSRSTATTCSSASCRAGC